MVSDGDIVVYGYLSSSWIFDVILGSGDGGSSSAGPFYGDSETAEGGTIFVGNMRPPIEQGNPPDEYSILESSDSAATANLQAKNITRAIISTNTVQGPVLYSWRNAEYGASVLRGSDGKFFTAAQAIYSQGYLTKLDFPIAPLGLGELFSGIIHNHPFEGGNAEWRLESRYPSSGDWLRIRILAEHYGVANPSLWIIDTEGVVREFSLSSRLFYESLSYAQLLNGTNLPPAIDPQ